MTAPPPLRVVRFDLHVNPAFDRALRAEPGIELDVQALPRTLDQVLAAIAPAHVYHVSSAKDELVQQAFVTESLLAHCPRLLAVSTYGAGYDSVDVAACTRAGVAVMNQAGANAVSVAEHALGLMLSVIHRIGESDRRLRHESGFSREDLMGRELHGKVLGLVGIGHVGTRVAALARAFGMEVIATDPYVPAGEIARRGARGVTLEQLLAASDVVSLHCPRDASTLRMMDAAAFARMKKGAIFVSTARGGIHDEAALAEALARGHLSGAGLDVWEKEPPPHDHPLFGIPNVVATFHTAGVTHEARLNIAVMGAAQIVALRRGERPPRLVNAEAWPRFRERFEAEFAPLNDIAGGRP
ncbi:MAG TPA: hydroxyacid dehydrogenase [Usitatibacter sp.]|nr:hydroxyacid dehydrogenase [Usitatibacter sp.]